MLVIIKPFSIRNPYKGGYIIGFFNPPEKNLPAEECYTNEWDCYSILKNVIKEMGPKVGCFTGFCPHHLTTMIVHMHEYRYPLFESGTKAGLRMVALCRKDRILLFFTSVLCAMMI